MAINLNSLAKSVTEQEGGRISLPIAQVKEVIRLTLVELAKVPASQVLTLLEKQVGPVRLVALPPVREVGQRQDEKNATPASRSGYVSSTPTSDSGSAVSGGVDAACGTN